ncbi:transcriptional regulator, partial [bacterium]|nr:transcriptional regulator [bacterium]
MDLTKVEKNQHMVEDLVEALDSKMFKALTDPTRTQILKYLMLNGRSDVSTIAEHMPQDRSVISR